MILYVVRHAVAGEHGDPRYPDDSLRPVTRKGNKQFGRLAKRLVRAGMAPRVIGASPYVRCVQTALALARRLEPPIAPQLVETFSPGCRWDDVLAWLLAAKVQDAAYVGHAPDVDRVAAAAVGAHGSAIRFAKGAIAAIEFAGQPAAGQGALKWLATPRLLR